MPQNKKRSKNSPTVSHSLISKAVQALLDYENKQNESSSSSEKNKKLSLFGDEDGNNTNNKIVRVQFGLDRVPVNPSPKPRSLKVPHSIWNIDDDDDGNTDVTICMFVKEGEIKENIKELIERFPKHMSCVKKVMGLDSLRRKFSSFEQRRTLLSQYDMFLCDDRILPMVGKAIGKNFFKQKKQPIPIQLTGDRNVPNQIRQALKSTHWYLSEGTCLSVKAGYLTTDKGKKNHIIDNILAIARRLPEELPRKWADVRCISIKTDNSTALPFYNKTPEELREIADLAGISQDDEASSKKRKKEVVADQNDKEDSPAKKKSKKRKKSSVTSTAATAEARRDKKAQESRRKH